MEIKQWINEQIPSSKSALFEEHDGAYRIGFQALPGTKFCICGEGNSESEIIMGPTGIYELGFVAPIIKDFYVKEKIDSPHSVLILDAILSTSSDEDITNYDIALITENYDSQEGIQTIIPTSGEQINRWEVGGAEI